MKPIAKFLSLAAPSLVLGGLLFQSPAGHADDKQRGAAVVKAKQKDHDLHISVDGVNVNFSGGLDGIRALVRGRLSTARQAIASADMPPQVRAKVLARFDRVNSIVDRRLSRIDFRNLEQLEAQMEGLGEEIEGAMEGLEEEMEALAKNDPNLRRQLKQLGALDLQLGGRHDDDDDDDGGRWGFALPPIPPTPPVPPVAPVAPMPPMPPVAPLPPYGYDADGSSYDAGDFDSDALQLRPDQRSNLRAVRQQSDAQIKTAKKSLERLSNELNAALRNPNAQPQEVNGLVDAISANEATIRKARINAWIRARNLLDARQRGVMERGR
jgi:hypothetical protein